MGVRGGKDNGWERGALPRIRSDQLWEKKKEKELHRKNIAVKMAMNSADYSIRGRQNKVWCSAGEFRGKRKVVWSVEREKGKGRKKKEIKDCYFSKFFSNSKKKMKFSILDKIRKEKKINRRNEVKWFSSIRFWTLDL
jgi:hypothetical protein